MKEPLRVVSVGEITIDDYLDLNRQYVGGISLNFAVHCKRSGAENVSLVSRVGRDNSDRILKKLAEESIDSSRVQVFDGTTAKQEIVLNADGDRIFPPGGYHSGVLEGYQLNKDEVNFIQQHNLLASPLFRQLETLFFQTLEFPFNGWRVADFLDLSDYNKDICRMEQIIDRLSIAFVSGDHNLVESLRPLSRTTRCLIVITLGADGSVALVNGEPVYQRSLEVSNVVDSTGCGDAFQAAFTVSYCNDHNVSRALQNGAQHAARVLQHFGATGD
jgi:fructoselysine 6-kinase